MMPKKGPADYNLNVSDENAISEIKDVLTKYREKDPRFYYKELEGKTTWSHWIESRLDRLELLVGNLYDDLIGMHDEIGGPVRVNKYAESRHLQVLNEKLNTLIMEMADLGFPVSSHDLDYEWICRKHQDKDCEREDTDAQREGVIESNTEEEAR